jgi:LmbE family N-acetylglucosaminyl deacetylase
VAYREDAPKPTFVVDVSATFERKLAAVRCYGSQFDGARRRARCCPRAEPLYDVVRLQAAHYGLLIRARYGEPFVTLETMRVEDVTRCDVSTF